MSGFLKRHIFTWGNRRPRRLCWAVGLYTFGYGLYDMTEAAIRHNTGEAHNFPKRYGTGSWVVISGANDAIGKEFATRFSQKGFNLILVDSDKKELDGLKETMSASSEMIRVETVDFDWARSNDFIKYQELCAGLQEIAGGKENISILVNNVEEMDPLGSKFHKASDESLLQTINLNTYPMVFMTRFLGPDMKDRKDTKSAIINMTSVYSEQIEASLPIYSSSKSFSDVWSQNVGYENQDMDVLTVKNMPTISNRNPLGVSALDTVDGVFRDLGQNRISYGHYTHSLYRIYYLFRQNQKYFNPNTALGRYAGL